jgi:hypothetical protein
MRLVLEGWLRNTKQNPMSPKPAHTEDTDNLLDTAKYSGIGAALTAVTNWVVTVAGAESMPGEVMAAMTLIYGTGIQWAWIKRKDAEAKKKSAERKAKAKPKPAEPPEPEQAP